MRYYLHLSYHGAAYRGWQTQAKVRSVQSTIRHCLSTILNKDTSVMGCSRTDAEVHARQYFAHFKFDDPLPDHFVHKLNRFLPKDIVIWDCIEVEATHHVQRDPLYKIYDYYVHMQKDPFLDKLSTLHQGEPLDLELMSRAVPMLIGKHDFKAFCTSPDLYTTTVRNMMDVKLKVLSENQIMLSFKGDRFLKYMVRILVGRLLDLGQSKLSLEEFKSMIVTGESSSFNKPAHPQGLYLAKVCYPYLDCPVRDNLAFQLK